MIKGSLLWNCLKAAVGAIPLNLMMSAVTLVICIVLGNGKGAVMGQRVAFFVGIGTTDGNLLGGSGCHP